MTRHRLEVHGDVVSSWHGLRVNGLGYVCCRDAVWVGFGQGIVSGSMNEWVWVWV